MISSEAQYLQELRFHRLENKDVVNFESDSKSVQSTHRKKQLTSHIKVADKESDSKINGLKLPKSLLNKGIFEKSSKIDHKDLAGSQAQPGIEELDNLNPRKLEDKTDKFDQSDFDRVRNPQEIANTINQVKAELLK